MTKNDSFDDIDEQTQVSQRERRQWQKIDSFDDIDDRHDDGYDNGYEGADDDGYDNADDDCYPDDNNNHRKIVNTAVSSPRSMRTERERVGSLLAQGTCASDPEKDPCRKIL